MNDGKITRLDSKIDSLERRKLMTRLLEDLTDEIETLSASYQDAQKEISILKRRLENEKLYRV